MEFEVAHVANFHFEQLIKCSIITSCCEYILATDNLHADCVNAHRDCVGLIKPLHAPEFVLIPTHNNLHHNLQPATEINVESCYAKPWQPSTGKSSEKISLNKICRKTIAFQYRWPGLIVLTTFQQLHLQHRPSLQLLKAAVQVSHAGSA